MKRLKALQLFARESDACVSFLSKVAKNSWAIPFQISAYWTEGAKEYQVDILKAKMSSVSFGAGAL